MCWIGAADLKAAEGNASIGPIASALGSLQFDRVVLLSNYADSENRSFTKWIGKRTKAQVTVEKVELSSPTDFGEVYQAADKACRSASGKNVELTFHLSPGTPAMSAVWILISKGRYPARLIESSPRFGVKETKVPFEISMEFVPELLRAQDARLSDLSASLAPPDPEFSDIIYRSREMALVIARARNYAVHNIPVLIEGETGTGKELLAKAIHNSSSRKSNPLKAINCGAIPHELVESELFGHEKGAFTGATQTRRGVFEEAHGSTLFLDEVGELPLGAQVKLLRVLQDQEVVKIGGSQSRKVDVRVIAATNRQLTDEVRRGAFREDLFYRLAVGVIKVPPLRDRSGDLTLLVDKLLARANDEAESYSGFRRRSLTAGARSVLLGHIWPGNVRELANTLRRLVSWSGEASISADDARQALFATRLDRDDDVLERELGHGFDIEALLGDVAKHYLSRAMKLAGGNKSKAASLLGLPSYQTLTNWLERYDVR